MHRMLHHDVGHASEQSIALASLGAPDQDHVEEVLTRSDRLDFDDVIASLEMDHGAFVEWEFNSTNEGQHAPEGLLSLLSVTLKRLLEGKEESTRLKAESKTTGMASRWKLRGLKPPPP
jgi:hypothetical protein